MADVRIEPLDAPFDVAFSPPGSKSLTNRAMVIAALCPGEVKLTNVLFADDTAVMIDSLRKLGFTIEIDEANRFATIVGQGGVIPAKSAELFCGNSGTTIRFVSALCARWAEANVFARRHCPHAASAPSAQLVAICSAISECELSQLSLGTRVSPRCDCRSNGGIARRASCRFISGAIERSSCPRCCMAAPYGAKRGASSTWKGKQTSWPYVAMTMRLMRRVRAVCRT